MEPVISLQPLKWIALRDPDKRAHNAIVHVGSKYIVFFQNCIQWDYISYHGFYLSFVASLNSSRLKKGKFFAPGFGDIIVDPKRLVSCCSSKDWMERAICFIVSNNFSTIVLGQANVCFLLCTHEQEAAGCHQASPWTWSAQGWVVLLLSWSLERQCLLSVLQLLSYLLHSPLFSRLRYSWGLVCCCLWLWCFNSRRGGRPVNFVRCDGWCCCFDALPFWWEIVLEASWSGKVFSWRISSNLQQLFLQSFLEQL